MNRKCACYVVEPFCKIKKKTFQGGVETKISLAIAPYHLAEYVNALF